MWGVPMDLDGVTRRATGGHGSESAMGDTEDRAQSRAADEREALADARERTADEREALADARERTADEREALADEGSDRLENLRSQLWAIVREIQATTD